MVEEWRPVPFGGVRKYEVSSEGRLRNQEGRIMNPSPNERGYLQASFTIEKRKKRTVKVHRVVALVFIGERPPGMQINHINGNKRDNRAENLEYVTGAENIRHACKNNLYDAEKLKESGRRLGALRKQKLKPEAVRSIRERVASGERASVLSEEYGVSDWTIGAIIRRRIWANID